jgi:hypothetical protein
MPVFIILHKDNQVCFIRTSDIEVLVYMHTSIKLTQMDACTYYHTSIIYVYTIVSVLEVRSS